MNLLPAPPRLLLLAPPREIRIGSLVRFTEKYVRGMRGTYEWQHWALVYGNGVGRVRNIKIWGGKTKPSAQIDFPHRMECHALDAVELALDTERTVSVLRTGHVFLAA